jgi:hypothetical protein
VSEQKYTAKYTHVYNLFYYTPKIWEYLLLLFRPLEVTETEGIKIWYKTIGKRLYIYDHKHLNDGEFDNCNQSNDGGYFNPWVN